MCCDCICRSIGDCIEAFAEYWAHSLRDAYTIEREPHYLAGATPTDGDDSYKRWNIEQLDPAQCKEFASEAYTDECWEHFKKCALAVGGAMVTAAIGAAMLFGAGLIIYITAEALEAIAAAYLAWCGGQELSLLGVGTIVTLCIAFEFEIITLMLCIISQIPKVMTKEVIPAITRSHNYASHLNEEARKLEIAGARV